MPYREFSPHPALARTVTCYWRLRATERPLVRTRVLPDGCFDLLFVLDAGASASGLRPGGYVVGPMTQGVLVTLSSGASIFGVRFRPGVLSPRFGGSLEALIDQSLAIETVLGAALLPWEAELADAVDDPTRVAILDRLLLGWARPPVERGPVEAGLRILSRGGGAGAPDLTEALGLGERTIQRLFAREVGFSPRLVARLLRFRRAVAILDQPERPSLTSLAYRLGYADQAHLTREFTGFAGVSPTAWLEERAGPGGFLSESFKAGGSVGATLET